MKQLIKINKKILLLAILLLMTAMFVISRAHRDAIPDIQCSAYLEQTSIDDHYIMKGTFIFSLKPNGSGVISADGRVNYKNNAYVLRRDAQVTFKHLNNNLWEFTSMKLFRNGSDTTPDEVVNHFFYSLDAEASHYFTLKKIDDYWLIGSLRSPSFLCKQA